MQKPKYPPHPANALKSQSIHHHRHWALPAPQTSHKHVSPTEDWSHPTMPQRCRHRRYPWHWLQAARHVQQWFPSPGEWRYPSPASCRQRALPRRLLLRRRSDEHHLLPEHGHPLLQLVHPCHPPRRHPASRKPSSFLQRHRAECALLLAGKSSPQ